MNEWYQNLNKPAWAPQEWVFGAVWSILYPIIIVVNIYVVYLFVHNKISVIVALPFWLNVVFNLAFTPIQFGLKNNALALVDITLVLITLHGQWSQFGRMQKLLQLLLCHTYYGWALQLHCN